MVIAQRAEGTSAMFGPRRFLCAACVSAASWSPKGQTPHWGAPVDPFFRLPLWLQTQCCGGRTLWAFNETHLALLEDYVAARLRERGQARNRMTLVARLPRWLKSAKNRDEVLRAITRLREAVVRAVPGRFGARRHGHTSDRHHLEVQGWAAVVSPVPQLPADRGP